MRHGWRGLERGRGANLIGVDIGGTFTDFVLLDGEKRSIRTAKMLTDPAEPGRVVLQGIARLPELLADKGRT